MKNGWYKIITLGMLLLLSGCFTGSVIRRDGVSVVSQKLPKDTPVIWIVPEDLSFNVVVLVSKYSFPPFQPAPTVSQAGAVETQFFYDAALAAFRNKVKTELPTLIKREGSDARPEVFMVVSPDGGGYRLGDGAGNLIVETFIKDRKTAQTLWSVKISAPYVSVDDFPRQWERYFELLQQELRKTGWL